MKNLTFILGMVFWVLTFFVGCTNNQKPLKTINTEREREGEGKLILDYRTITVFSVLQDGHTVTVQSEHNEGTLSGAGQCIRVRSNDQNLVISVKKQDHTVSLLCSNADENKNNDCKGNYAVYYENSQTGKLILESTDRRNESKNCIALWPEDEIYTITMVSNLGNRTVKVQNNRKTKTLKEKGSCLKLIDDDFWKFQIDVGEGNHDRQILCAGGEDEINSDINSCEEARSYEISLFGQLPEPDLVVLNPVSGYNDGDNCEWFNEDNLR